MLNTPHSIHNAVRISSRTRRWLETFLIFVCAFILVLATHRLGVSILDPILQGDGSTNDIELVNADSVAIWVALGLHAMLGGYIWLRWLQ